MNCQKQASQQELDSSMKQNDTCPSDCTEHLFEMASKGRKNFYKQHTSVSFCSKNSGKCLPTFLQPIQQSCYLPLFGLNEDLSKYVNQKKLYQQAFQKQLTKSTEESTTKHLPMLRPIPKKKYCQLCRVAFEDYEIHIATGNHKKMVRTSYGTSFINEQISQYNSVHQDLITSRQYCELLNANKFLRKARAILKVVLTKTQ